MTLRDRFALAAPGFPPETTERTAEVYAETPAPPYSQIRARDAWWAYAEARYRYQYADAMLAARRGD